LCLGCSFWFYVIKVTNLICLNSLKCMCIGIYIDVMIFYFESYWIFKYRTNVGQITILVFPNGILR
jgi:hypothetical protein